MSPSHTDATRVGNRVVSSIGLDTSPSPTNAVDKTDACFLNQHPASHSDKSALSLLSLHWMWIDRINKRGDVWITWNETWRVTNAAGCQVSPPHMQTQLIYRVRSQITFSTQINWCPMTFYPNYCSLHMKCNGWQKRQKKTEKKTKKQERMSEGWDKKRMNVWERECRLTDYFRLPCRSKCSSQHCHEALGW